jgi:hypothetical protein
MLIVLSLMVLSLMVVDVSSNIIVFSSPVGA